MVYIYVLALQQEKYYIGKTNNISFRLDNHFNSNGSEWTKLYKPISVLELIPDCDDYDEDKYVKIYMDKFGIDNVRGGSFSSVILNQETINLLIRMNRGTNDKCFNCGSADHFVKDCKNLDTTNLVNNTDIDTTDIDTADINPADIDTTDDINPADDIKNNYVLCEIPIPCKCIASYIYNHYVENCYLNTKQLEPQNTPTPNTPTPNKQRTLYPLRTSSKQRTPSKHRTSSKQPIKKSTCSRCGRNTHTIKKCYAKTHLTGFKL